MSPTADRARRTSALIRAYALDAALVVLLTAGCLVVGWQRHEAWGAVTVMLSTLPLLTRRHWPLAGFAVQALAVGLTGQLSQAPVAVLFALMIGGYAAIGIGTSGVRPRLIAAAGSATAVILVYLASAGDRDLIGLCALWTLAFAVRSLWQRSQTAQQYAQALEREVAARQALAVQGERERIARELHDVLGHNLSVMMIHAGAARQAVDGQPEATRSLLQVEASGREAMTELRSLLLLLGTEQDAPAPQPRLTDVDKLVARTRSAGLPARLVTRGPVRPLEPGLELAAYRVVQEGLTNALKYAAGAPTEVIVAYEPTALHVTVLDQGTNTADSGPHASGSGQLGLRERVALYHGRLHAGPEPGGGYRLHAEFPLELAADPVAVPTAPVTAGTSVTAPAEVRAR